MRPDDVPVLAALRQSLNFHADRQRVIAENVANANTPGYAAKDLDETSFQQALRQQMQGSGAPAPAPAAEAVQMRVSQAGHIPGTPASGSSTWRTQEAPDSETTINGNSVVLEEQMVRGQENRMRYESALTLYQKSLGLIRLAIRPPAR